MAQKGFVPKSVREALGEPRPCKICGELFRPKVPKSKICVKSECKRQWCNRKARKTDYSKGRVWVLDMSLPEWEFIEENRGD